MDSDLLPLISGLADRDSRKENAISLARFVGAEDLVIFTLDSDARIYLPVLGFRQTFPEGRKLRNFLEECLKQGKHQAEFRFTPEAKSEQVVQGHLASDDSILVLAGGKPIPEKIKEICQVVPLLNFGFKCERDLHSVSAQARVLSNAMNESEAFSKALDQTRRQLEIKVAELRTSEVTVRSLADNSQKALESLQHERDLREQFVATLTHDLRSPITSARISAQIIMKKTDTDDHAYRLASKVVNSIDRVDQMIQNLLDANLIRAGEKMPIQFLEFDLNEVLKETLDELATTHGDRFNLVADDDIKVIWSSSAIRRVIENLATNGIKYGSPYRPVTITLLISTEGKIKVSVHNEGNPLTDEELANIFEPYRRTRSAQSGQQKGWGLGLTLVKGIVEAHHGQTLVESSPEKGTIFTILIPRDAR